MFAAFKIAVTFALACASVVAAIVESGHPLLFGCLCIAFILGVVAAETHRGLRKQAVRSAVKINSAVKGNSAARFN
ncbi:MAG TPA: hypothetical protein VIY54_13705 [Steroidobacteraceae bacterium]